MNRILSISVAIIVIILSVEAGYYWGIKNNPQASQISQQVVKKTNPLNVLTPTTQPKDSADNNVKNLLNQKNLELSKAIKTASRKVASNEIPSATQELIKIGALKAEIGRLFYKSIKDEYYTALMSIPNFGEFPDDENLKSKFISEFKKLDFNSMATSNNNDLAKIFYRLGLIAYQNNQKDLVAPLWTTMVNLSPEWSHFQLELANYYLVTGNIQSAKNAINYCLNFSFPEEICNSFLLNEIQNNQPHQVGFMEEKVKTEVVNN